MCLYIETDDKTDKLLLFRKITKTVTTGKISLNKNLVLKSVHFLDAWPVLKKGKMWVVSVLNYHENETLHKSSSITPHSFQCNSVILSFKI